jgi:hypothetical protein
MNSLTIFYSLKNFLFFKNLKFILETRNILKFLNLLSFNLELQIIKIKNTVFKDETIRFSLNSQCVKSLYLSS